MDRRSFLAAGVAGAAVTTGAMNLLAAEKSNNVTENKNEKTSNTQEKKMKIVVTADPFATDLKNAIVKHLKEKGHTVLEVTDAGGKDPAYYDGAVEASKYLADGRAERGIFFCGTGMGMSILANKQPSVVAAVVESVWAAKMCRAVNNANVLCLGAMLWGEWMAKDAVDAFLTTNLADGLPDFKDFLVDADKKCRAIDAASRK